jgi:ABC-type uncharacterized transport system substrate-binding protein
MGFRFRFYLILVLGALPSLGFCEEKRCLYVASYHQGYAWQDGVESALIAGIKGKCDLRVVHMDTKRNSAPEFGRSRAIEAKTLIESWKPHVVLLSDDNAVRYLLVEHFKNSLVPFVFCGVNWSIKEYGLPYANTAGMIEVNHTDEMFAAIKEILPKARRAVCLDADNESSRKVCERVESDGRKLGMRIDSIFVKTAKQWMDKYRTFQAQREIDFVVTPNDAGFAGWNREQIAAFVLEHGRKLTLGLYESMISQAMLVFVTDPREQGDYAAAVARRILEGAKPSEFPIVTNRKARVLMNTYLTERAAIAIPGTVVQTLQMSEQSKK